MKETGPSQAIYSPVWRVFSSAVGFLHIKTHSECSASQVTLFIRAADLRAVRRFLRIFARRRHARFSVMKDIYFNRWLAASAAATRMTCSFRLNFPHRRRQIRRAKGVNRLCTWLFFLCLLHMQRRQRSRRSDLSISSWLEVAGAIMGNGQEKKKTFNTRVLLASVLFTDCPCTLKVGAPLIGTGVCQKQLKQLTECLNAYFSDYI